MAATRTILLAVAAMAILSTASAAIYKVGEPGGAWDLSTNYGTWASSRNFHASDQIIFKYSPQAHDVLEVSKTDYDSWASSRNFHASDQIIFKYSPQAHDVLEVSKTDYDSCSTASPIATLNSGNDVVSLTTTGTRYFISDS
ncbi:uclacyanin 1-like [Aegilops tauschii subsp. strangulata]|uniref:uclacyanin 1-like n=1 Tax=Aegilops tauschii subsp. strangulata TaxID=200361 RepID=UPI001ABC6F2B|nr:blue copper protein-like [Aegilops tauschii subsp. strangulata]